MITIESHLLIWIKSVEGVVMQWKENMNYLWSVYPLEDQMPSIFCCHRVFWVGFFFLAFSQVLTN